MLPFGSIRIGRLFGIDIEVNYSWFLIFALVTINMSFLFVSEKSVSPVSGVAAAVFASLAFFASVLLHELSHSLVARMFGIPIKKITLFIFGGVSQMTGEPKTAGAEFFMAVAGPLSSFVLGALFAGAYLASAMVGAGVPVTMTFSILAYINVVLGVFNLAPGFPLDGGRVLRAILWKVWGDIRRATRVASRIGQGLAMLLIVYGFIEVLGQRNISGIWLVLIGWFLNNTAQSSYQHLLLERSLSDVKVSRIMAGEVVTVPPDVTLQELVDRYFMQYRFGRFPVVDGGHLLGVVTLHDVKDTPRERWVTTTVREVATPVSPGLTIGPEDEAVRALMQMANEDVGHLLVVSDGDLVGLVTRADIIRLIKIKSQLEV